MFDQFQRMDAISGWSFLVIIVALLFAFEIGRHLGRRRKAVKTARQLHAANVLSGLLVLLSFLLAFSFGLAADYFQQRRQVVLDEANAIGTTYLRSKYLPEPQSEEVERLMLEYVNLRIAEASPEELAQARTRSEALQGQLWKVAASLEEQNPNSEFAGLFIASLNEMIDLHQTRVTTALDFRLPLVVLVTLYVVAFLTLLVMGYNAGLGGTGDAVLTVSAVLCIAVVLVLINDLNRPVQRTFEVSQQAIIDVRDALEEDIRRHP